MSLKVGVPYIVTLDEGTMHCKIKSGDIVIWTGQTLGGSFAYQHQFNLVKGGVVVERDLGLALFWCKLKEVKS